MTTIVRTLGLLTLTGLVALAFLFLFFDSFRTETHYYVFKGCYLPCTSSYCFSPSFSSPPPLKPDSSTHSDSVATVVQPSCECPSCRSRRPSGALSAATAVAARSK